MSLPEYILYNGSFALKSNFSLSITNRAFRFGDGLFETMFGASDNIFFFEDHLQSLYTSLIHRTSYSRNM